MVEVNPSDTKRKPIILDGRNVGYAKLVDVDLGDTFRFECQRCGECCSRPPAINPYDASRISKHLGISKVELFKNYVTMLEDPFYVWKVKLEYDGDMCIFHEKEDGKAVCNIQDVKPRQCRARPLAALSGRPEMGLDALELVIQPCIGLGKGEKYTVEGWIKMNNLDPAWREEIEYIERIKSLKIRIPKKNIMAKIIDMFVL